SSTWKLKRMRRARANSERLSVISMLRDSSARPLLAAALAWEGPEAGGAPGRPAGGVGVAGWAGCMASRRSFSSSFSTSKERLLPLDRLALERGTPAGGAAAGADGLEGCGAGAAALAGSP